MLLKRTPLVAEEMCYTTTSRSHWAAGSTIDLLGHLTSSQSKQQVLLPCYYIFSLTDFHLGKVVSRRNKQFKVLMLGD